MVYKTEIEEMMLKLNNREQAFVIKKSKVLRGPALQPRSNSYELSGGGGGSVPEDHISTLLLSKRRF
jgi:hypothetical protein